MTEDNKVETPAAEVDTKRVAMRKYDPKGKILWEVKADRASGELSPQGDYTEVDGVSAMLYDEGKPAFELTAKKGNVSKSTGKLDLHGDVEGKSVDGRTSLGCDRIRWNNKDELLLATGNVSAESAGMRLSGASEARVKFKNIREKMNTSTATALIFTSLIVQGPRIHYRDLGGNMDVGADTFKVTFDQGANLYRFVGTGSPFTAKWLKQGITITGRQLTGAFAPVKDGSSTRYELQRGKFTGNITAKLDGDRGNMDISGVDELNLDFVADSKRWKFGGSGGPFKVVLPDSGTMITGNQFEGFAAVVAGKPEWQSAVFTGGVTAVVTQIDKKTGKSFTITASCPRVDFNRAERSATLSGGARAVGNHPAMGPDGAEITAPTIILRFNEAMTSVEEVEMK